MKEKNELKKQGKCECKATDILCKTMCGTLLGPDAKDATKDSPRARYAGKKLKGEVPAATVEGDKKKKKK